MSSHFLEHFSELEDPRIDFLSVCAVLSGADGWESIEEFGEGYSTGCGSSCRS